MSTIVNDNPNVETSESQRKKILAYLQQGETITALEALMLFKCFRLASRMNDLKNDNVEFDSVFVETPTSSKRVKAYYIPEAFAKKNGLVQDKELANKAVLYAENKIGTYR